MVCAEGEKRRYDRDQLQYPPHDKEVLLIFLQVGKGNHSLPDSLDIYFIDYFIEEFADKMVSAVDVHALIALFEIDDETIDAVHHEFADVERGLKLLYFGWHYAQNIPEDCSDRTSLLELAVDVCIADRAVSEVIVVACSPETQGFKPQSVLLLLVTFGDSLDEISDFDILKVLIDGRMQFNESNVVFHFCA